MSCYLYPEKPSKAAYKKAIAAGEEIIARENTPWGLDKVKNAEVAFEGPHYPKPHKYYGKAKVVDGRVVKVT